MESGSFGVLIIVLRAARARARLRERERLTLRGREFFRKPRKEGARGFLVATVGVAAGPEALFDNFIVGAR